MAESKTKYFFQKRKRSFAQKFFKHGLNAACYILFSLKEGGRIFLTELPSSYPGFKLMKDMFGKSYKKPVFKKETVRTNLYRLRKQGLVAKDTKQKVYYLTGKGQDLVDYIQSRHRILKKSWDGRLRIVIFDIPEEKKYWREIIRQELFLLYFQRLQKSVYVGKYPVPEGLYKEMQRNGLSKYIFIFTVDRVDREEEVLKLLEKQNWKNKIKEKD